MNFSLSHKPQPQQHAAGLMQAAAIAGALGTGAAATGDDTVWLARLVNPTATFADQTKGYHQSRFRRFNHRLGFGPTNGWFGGKSFIIYLAHLVESEILYEILHLLHFGRPSNKQKNSVGISEIVAYRPVCNLLSLQLSEATAGTS